MALVDNFTLSVPPQKTALIDPAGDNGDDGGGRRNGAFGTNLARLFSRVWWKFFSGVVDQLRALWEEADALQAEIDALVPGTFFSYVTDGVTTGDAATVLSGGTSPLVSPTATPTTGDLWTAYLTQPAAGNELVDLTGIVPDVHGLSLTAGGEINNVSRGANKVTALSFICRDDGDWWLKAVMVLA